MQTARCAYDLPGGSLARTAKRKILEMVLAYRISRHFTKEQILELYLNHANFAGCRGLRSAARTHFGIEPHMLTPEQVLWLVSTLPAPTRRANHQNAPTLLKKAIEQLQKCGRVDADLRVSNTIDLDFANPSQSNRSPVSWEAEFQHALKASVGQELPIRNLTVCLTLDFALQRDLQRIVTRNVGALSQNLPASVRGELDAGLIVLRNGTAEVLACIPSADTTRWYSNATQAKRGIGSTFKTFTLAAAIENGLAGLNSIVLDTPLLQGEVPSANGWSPRDCDRRFRGAIPLLEAFVDSRNLPFVRMGEKCRFHLATLLPSLGLPELKLGNPSQFIGTYGGTPLAVGAAYAAFGNDGIFIPPRIVRQVSAGSVVSEVKPQPCRVVSSQTSAAVLAAMREVVRTGTAARLGRAGLTGGAKTGTTTAATDLWLCYIEQDFTICLWVGRRDNKPLWQNASSGSIQRLAIESVLAVKQSLAAHLTSPHVNNGYGRKDPGTVTSL
jgi:membrane peptidoglycan carboxypeptidase